jgi:thiol:disulfide interchange protein
MKTIKLLTTVLIFWTLSYAAQAANYGFDTSSPASIMTFIQQHHALVYLTAFFALGILLAFTPCVLPMVPILSGIIVGQKDISTTKAFKLSLSYVIGMALTYAIAGMLAAWLGSTVQTIMQQPAVLIGFSLIFVLMALSMFGVFELKMPSGIQARLNQIYQKETGSPYLTVALMGIISTLIVSPCVTAPLIGVLSYIGQQGKVVMGGLILFVMALGMGLPLLLVGAGYGHFLPKTGAWMIKVKQFFALMMLAMAIWILGRILPTSLTGLLWAAFLIFTGILMGLLQKQNQALMRLFQVLGLFAVMCAGALVHQNLTIIFKGQEVQKNASNVFKMVHSTKALEKQLTLAKDKGKAVFVEFFASWCSDCQNMDKKVFNQKDIQEEMKDFVNLRVDISKNTPEVKAIKKQYAIYGIPSLLFFDSQGKLLEKFKAAGFIKHNKMLRLFKRAKDNS